MIVGILVIFAMLGIILIPRTRINKYPSRTYGVDERDQYKPFEKSMVKRLEDDFQPSKKMLDSTTGNAQFCSYCGTMLEEGLVFCENCGNKIE